MRIVSITLAAAAFGTTPAIAQFPPDSLVNVKFFPSNMPVRELIGEMRDFTFALGVRCEFCHVGEAGQPLSAFDFPSDAKRTKRTARLMLEMVRTINERTLPEIPDRRTPHVAVTCVTCHRGINRPRMITDLMLDAVHEGGLDSATTLYHELRTNFYGSGSFDFGERPMIDVASRLVADQRLDEALGVLELVEEYFAESFTMNVAMGDVLARKGESAAAITRYEKAIELNPEARPFLTPRIEQLRRP